MLSWNTNTKLDLPQRLKWFASSVNNDCFKKRKKKGRKKRRLDSFMFLRLCVGLLLSLCVCASASSAHDYSCCQQKHASAVKWKLMECKVGCKCSCRRGKLKVLAKRSCKVAFKDDAGPCMQAGQCFLSSSSLLPACMHAPPPPP